MKIKEILTNEEIIKLMDVAISEKELYSSSYLIQHGIPKLLEALKLGIIAESEIERKDKIIDDLGSVMLEFSAKIEFKESHYNQHIELLNHSHEQEIEEKDKLIFQQEWTLGDNKGTIKNLKNQIESKDKEIAELKEWNKKLLDIQIEREQKYLDVKVQEHCNESIQNELKNAYLSEIQSLKEEVERLKGEKNCEHEFVTRQQVLMCSKCNIIGEF